MEKIAWIGWGPGGSHFVEAKWFQNKKNFNVWKQPNLSQKMPNAWSVYVDDAILFLRSLSINPDESKNQIRLIVHSFGLQVLLECLRRGEKFDFSQITALATTFNPFSPYENLANHFGLATNFSASAPTESAFMKTFSSLGQVPELMDAYWANPASESHQKYLAIVEGAPMLDFETYLSVNLDLLRKIECGQMNPDFVLNEPSEIPIIVHVGTVDPLIDVEKEKVLWKKYFPKHSFTTHRCGHYPQFELPIEHICNDRSA